MSLTAATRGSRKYLAKRRVANRYDVATRTVDRRVKKKLLPPPDLVINKRPYWDEEHLDEHDRQQTIAAVAHAE